MMVTTTQGKSEGYFTHTRTAKSGGYSQIRRRREEGSLSEKIAGKSVVREVDQLSGVKGGANRGLSVARDGGRISTRGKEG